MQEKFSFGIELDIHNMTMSELKAAHRKAQELCNLLAGQIRLRQTAAHKHRPYKPRWNSAGFFINYYLYFLNYRLLHFL